MISIKETSKNPIKREYNFWWNINSLPDNDCPAEAIIWTFNEWGWESKWTFLSIDKLFLRPTAKSETMKTRVMLTRTVRTVQTQFIHTNVFDNPKFDTNRTQVTFTNHMHTTKHMKTPSNILPSDMQCFIFCQRLHAPRHGGILEYLTVYIIRSVSWWKQKSNQIYAYGVP